jgi:hypothetical protein
LAAAEKLTGGIGKTSMPPVFLTVQRLKLLVTIITFWAV